MQVNQARGTSNLNTWRQIYKIIKIHQFSTPAILITYYMIYIHISMFYNDKVDITEPKVVCSFRGLTKACI